MKSDSMVKNGNVAPVDVDPVKVVLVTGAGQGIGHGVAAMLIQRGWRVHVNVRDAAKRGAWTSLLGERCVHGGDLVDQSTAQATVAAVLEVEGRLDSVVHAVGPYTTSRLSESTVEAFRSMWDGNVLTALHVMAAAREPIRQAAGSYLFFGCAGLDRWRTREVTPAYISAKAALLVAVRSLALEEAQYGVRANMISPGFVPHDGAAADTMAPELQAKIPIGRTATMDEVTNAAAWLLSDEATHVVGQNLEIAGGWML